jgi:protein-disulfide isomerase
LRIIYKISKKFKKIYKIVGLFKQSQMVEFNDYVCSKYCRKEISEMKEIKNKTKNLYYKKYFV